MSQAVLETKAEGSVTPSERPQENATRRRKKAMLISGGGALLILLLVFGVRYLIWSAHHENTDDAYLAGHVHPNGLSAFSGVRARLFSIAYRMLRRAAEAEDIVQDVWLLSLI